MIGDERCVPVPIGADERGCEEVRDLTDGDRESTRSRRELLLDLKRRGLSHTPEPAIGDGAPGFRAAPREAFGTTKERRCRVHETADMLDAMPKSVQAKAKGHLHDIRRPDTKAVGKLTKDRDVLLDFHDFPAERRKHVRTTNPIESTFATVRHRTNRTKGCPSRKIGLAMAFELMISAQGQMAQDRRIGSPARSHPGHGIRRWNRETETCRLIGQSSTFGHGSVELRKTLPISLDDLLSVVREFLNPSVSRSGLDAAAEAWRR